MKKSKILPIIVLSFSILLAAQKDSLENENNQSTHSIAFDYLPTSETNSSFETESEDELIIKALYYDVNNPRLAAKAWKELFLKTNNDEYLIEYFNDALVFKDIKEVIAELKEILKNKKNKELHELLANLYIKEGSNSNAIDILENVKNLDSDALYQLAYLYLLTNKDEKALAIYKKLYESTKSWDALKGELAIYAKRNETAKVKEILWNEIQTNPKLSKEAYLTYLGLIDLKENTDEALFIFKKLYDKTHNKDYLKELISLYIYKKDYEHLIPLLQETHYDNKLLYELQISNGNLEDAVKTVDELYKNTKKPSYLAEKAILMYELATKYNAVNEEVIHTVAQTFEKAFELGLDDDMYYNYYGYILIDNNIDIKKGVSLVQKATQKNEGNIYYLDSLAWGYYKLNKCKEAKDIIAKMKKISSDNIEEDEILKHIKAINQKCTKDK